MGKISENFKSLHKNLNQFRYHVCVCFFCSLILLKFNKENVFSKLRKSTLKMRQSTQEPRAAWLTRWNIKKFFSVVLNV